MANLDDVLINKAAIIERCLQRIQEEYQGHESELYTNFTRQDAIVLNLQRACEASIDMATRVIRLKKLGIPQNSRDVFSLLEQAQLLPANLSHQLQAMVGFRNIAVHNYQQMNLKIVEAILTNRLADFQQFSQLMLAL